VVDPWTTVYRKLVVYILSYPSAYRLIYYTLILYFFSAVMNGVAGKEREWQNKRHALPISFYIVP
jgi:hypothetical protein